MEDKEILLSEDAQKAIASTVIEGLKPAIVEQSEKAAKDAVKVAMDAAEEIKKKDIKKEDTPANINIITANGDRKEVKFLRAIKSLRAGDMASVKAYNESVTPDRQKAGYANETVTSEGGALVPPADFEAEVEKLVPNYGIAFQDADVRQVSGNAVITNKRGSNVTMFETGEGVAKTGTKMGLTQQTVTLRKFAAISPLTDELNDDSAVDFYNELIQGFAEERARFGDILVFTENGITSAKKGLLRTAGVNVEPIASVASITWDDVLNAESYVPTAAEANAKWYMHKRLWNLIKQAKDSQGRYQALPFAAKQTPWGTPVTLADIMPLPTDVDSDGSTPLAVYGDLKRVKLYVKRGLVIDILKEGTVHGSDGAAINLGEQDMTAIRAVTRMVALVKFPEAFTVLGTGNVS